MTATDRTAKMPRNQHPPVEWSLARRLGSFGGTGLFLATVMGGWQLLFADFDKGVMFSGRVGWVPIWPRLVILVSWLVGSGLLIGLLLPLYKRAYGGACVGLAVWALLVSILFMFGELPGDPTALIQPWQRAMMLVILGGMAVAFGTSASDRALGRT